MELDEIINDEIFTKEHTEQRWMRSVEEEDLRRVVSRRNSATRVCGPSIGSGGRYNPK